MSNGAPDRRRLPNPARLRRELMRSRRSAATVLSGAALVAVGWGFILMQIGGTVGDGTQTVRFEVDDATSVVAKRDDVRVLGIPAGRISAVDLVDGHAVITAKVKKNYGTIYRDARAMLRPGTALQDMYLDIVDRGTPGAGRASSAVPLPSSRTNTSVNVNDVLQAFDPRVREHVAVVLDGLGNGLADRGARLQEGFRQIAPFLVAADRVSRQLRMRASSTRRLVTNFADLTGEMRRRQTQLRAFVGNGARTLQTLQVASPDLDATLRELPGTLTRARTAVAGVDGVLGDVDQAVRRLQPVAADLPAGLRAVRSISADATPAVRALQSPVRRLVPLTRDLQPLAADLDAALTALAPQVSDIDHATKVLEACTKSTALQKFFQWTPSVFKLEDARGSYARGDAHVSLESGSTVTDPLVTAPDKSCVIAPKRK